MDCLSLLLTLLVWGQGSPDWATRELCSAKLQALLPHSAPFLEAGTKSKDAEIAVRCEEIFLPLKQAKQKADFAKLVESCKPKGWTQWPEIESHPDAPFWLWRETVMYVFLHSAGKETNWWGSPSRRATELLVIHLLQSGTSPESVRKTVQETADRESKGLDCWNDF